ncbi:MAG TPA: glycosyltransferase [Bryobacteraceae bacterium]|nr:glycosyltransferase [Bryobacteraceae bacterium]
MLPVRLSILVPVYNEENYVVFALERVAAAVPAFDADLNVEAEIIVVDDGSSDRSHAAVQEFVESRPEIPVQLIRHSRNQGKGAAIRTALAHARSDIAIIQDADLEYDPRDYPKLLRPLLADEADAVIGSRFLLASDRPLFSFWHAQANRVITALAGMAANLNLSDVESGYKAFRTSLAQSIPLRSKGFGLGPELIIKFAKRHARIYEAPVKYHGRTHEDGKKIGLRDALVTFGTILRTWVSTDVYTDPSSNMLGAMARAQRFNSWMADTLWPFIDGHVLELGAGIGNLTRLLCPGRPRYVATDSSEEHLAELRARLHHQPNLEIALCDLLNPGELSHYTSSMDTVVCLNVLEHIEDDRAGLRNICSCLRRGGRAILLVPQGPTAFGTLDGVLGHYRRYTKRELEQKMAAAGFRVERLLDFNRPTYPGWILNGQIFRRKTLSRVQLRLFDWCVPLWRAIDAALPWPATSVIGIGVRER